LGPGVVYDGDLEDFDFVIVLVVTIPYKIYLSSFQNYFVLVSNIDYM
jgi:hypothetical protein